MSRSLDLYFIAFIDLLGFSQMVKSDLEAPLGLERNINKLYIVHQKTKDLISSEIDMDLVQFSDSVVLATKFNKDNFPAF